MFSFIFASMSNIIPWVWEEFVGACSFCNLRAPPTIWGHLRNLLWLNARPTQTSL